MHIKTYLNPNFKENANICISVVVTFYNHQNLVNVVLNGIMDSLKLNYELIIINDGSNKSTDFAIKDFLRKANFPLNLNRVLYKKLKISRFETRCDNLGARIATGKYLLFVQGDMVINDQGFDKRLITLLEFDEKIGAISGHNVRTETNDKMVIQWETSRGTSINLRNLRKFQSKNFEAKYKNKNIAWIEKYDSLDVLIKSFQEFRSIGFNNTANGLNVNLLSKNVIFIGKYINRGPIIIEKQYFEHLGMYKDNVYFQGFDDIDLSLQICKDGKVVGFSPINYVSKDGWGASWKKKSWLIILNILLQIIKRRINRNRSLLLDRNLALKKHTLHGQVIVVESRSFND